jgi:hypothetical protein
MNRLKIFVNLILLLIFSNLTAQTVVKMDMPSQADQPLQVLALFDEELPEGIPVVLGLMGYDIAGGITPYTYEWLLNGEIISTNDVAIFTPSVGDDLVLTVTDNNVCSASTAFNLKIAEIPGPEQNENDFVRIFPTMVKSEIQIEFDELPQQESLVRIFSLSGKMVFEHTTAESTLIYPALEPGIYFVSVKSGLLHKIEKIVAL